MDDSSIDVEDARRLGHDVATYSHEALPTDRIDQLSTLTEDVATSLEQGSVKDAAAGLLNFWAGHVAGDLEVEENPTAFDPSEPLFENGLESGGLGVDLYQALLKTTEATEEKTDGPDLSGWTDRLYELTRRHVAHLESHD